MALNTIQYTMLVEQENRSVIGTYYASNEGMYIVLDKNCNYCIYKPHEILEVGSYDGVDDVQFVLSADSAQYYSACSALYIDETIYLISNDGSVCKFEFVSQIPYYDNVPEVLNLPTNNY